MPEPIDRKALFESALTTATAELDQELRTRDEASAASRSMPERGMDTIGAIAAGAVKGGYETLDTIGGIFGQPEPTYAEKDPFRRRIEQESARLDRQSPVNAIAGDIAQFGIGLLGFGKVKLATKAPAALRWGVELAKGAAIGATVFDPQEERLSNFIESYPELHNPVTDYLAADLSDSDAEGRFKSAVEGLGLDLAITGTLGAAVKVFRLVRGGAPEAAVSAAESELDAALAAQRDWETNGPQPTGVVVDNIEDTFGAQDGSAPKAENIPTQVKGLIAATEGEAEATPTPSAPTRPANFINAEGVAEITVPGNVSPAPMPSTPPARSPVDVETEDLTALLTGWEADTAALTKWGSREAAEASGHRFGATGSLPWQKLNAEGGLRPFTERVAETFKTDLDAMKGGEVLTDARVNAMVAQRTWLYGEDPASLMGMLRTAGAEANTMVANMEAGFLVANKALADTYRLAARMRQGDLADFAGDTIAAEKALRQRLRLAVEALGESRAMSAAAGRSLRRMRGQFRVDPETLAQLDTLDIDRLTDLLYQSQGNPKALAQIAQPGWLDRAVRGTGSLMANNLLWAWPSHVINTVTSAYMSGIRPAERIVGSYFNGGGAAMRTKALREYRYMVSALGDAWHAATQAFLTGDSVMAPHQTEWFKAASQKLDGSTSGAAFGFAPVQTVGDVLTNGLRAIDGALRFPTRALGTVDEFIKQMSYRGYVQADASIKADQMGLAGSAHREYVAKALSDAFDADYRATNQAALHEAQVRTFSQPLLPGTAGNSLQNLVSTHPSLRAIFPFVRTPINVFRYSIKNLPGLNLVQKEYREMIAGKHGPELQASAYGQMVMGSVALAIAGHLTADGRITGGGPRDPAQRQALEATGWKPYSFIRETSDGTHTYVPYNRLDPIGMLFGVAADVTEINLTDPEASVDELAVALVLAVSRNITDRTYLQNVTSFMRAASDPEASGNKFLGQLGENLIPASSLLRQMNTDPYMREARSLVDNAMDRIPGYSATLAPRRDAFGDPVKVRTGLIFQDNASDIVDAEQQRLILETGTGILPMGATRSGVGLRDLPLTVDGRERTAFDVLQELAIKPKGFGLTIKEALAKEITSERYQMAPDGAGDVQGTKAFLLKTIVGDYREAAYKQLLAQYPKEVGDPLARRDLEAREAWRQAKEAKGATTNQVTQLRDFAASYGVRLR